MKNKSFLVQHLIAHRGVHYLFRENTLSAFQMAIEKKYIIELDVHLSLDQEIIVFHDYTLNRLFKVNQFIKNLSLADLRKYHISTLEEVLDFVHGRVPVIVELKVTNKVFIKKLIALLDCYQGEFAIQSFNPFVIYYFRLVRAHYVRGYLFYDFHSFLFKILLNHKLLSFILKPDFIGINLSSLTLSTIQDLRNKYIIIGYTIKTREEYLKYLNMADNFICDIPKNGFKL